MGHQLYDLDILYLKPHFFNILYLKTHFFNIIYLKTHFLHSLLENALSIAIGCGAARCRFIYSLLENRLKSLSIEKLGLVLIRDNVESTILALREELKINSTLSNELSAGLLDSIDKWRKDRNNVIHFLTQERIDETELSKISLEGEELLRKIAAVNMRVKKRLRTKAA